MRPRQDQWYAIAAALSPLFMAFALCKRALLRNR